MPVVDEGGALVEGTDANTQGRYAVHFHLRSGARADVAPNVFRNSVIVDSPKHGLVNHGGNVLAEGNVTFRVDGSHFFAENGSEIGALCSALAPIKRDGLRNKVDEYMPFGRIPNFIIEN